MMELARDLKAKTTAIDGWCSSCHQIDKHTYWCPWTRLLAAIERADKIEAERDMLFAMLLGTASDLASRIRQAKRVMGIEE
jgi:hypothetical protein